MGQTWQRPQRSLAAAFLFLALGFASPAALADGAAAASLPRAVALAGAVNFRDLGGYTTTDGRRVKTGKIYRSDNLSALSADDWQRLRQLGLGLVVDFRSRDEIAATPPGIPADIALLELPMGIAGVDIEDLRKRVASGDFETIELPNSYSNIAFHQTDPLREWFRVLLNDTPSTAVFHCTSGKDRTGLAALLLLSALGVSEKDALDDFEASNQFLAPGIAKTVARVRAQPQFKGSTAKLEALLGVRREQMAQTLADIRERYGSVDRYLEQALGVDAARRQALRQRYLD